MNVIDGGPGSGRHKEKPEKTPSGRILLPKKEYARVMSAIRTNYHDRFVGSEGALCSIAVGKHHYMFINNGIDGDFIIVHRVTIKSRGREDWRRIERGSG